ncbi:MAG: hypothetical protein KBE25_00480 [Laribacter sp.]|nr:hypothetical protein [Laribacter sp.]MBP9607821.1 hypothetical protein [Laribacter sp.]
MKFIDVLQTPGASALGPLRRRDGSQHYFACWNGAPLLRDGKWEGSFFQTEQEAIDMAARWAEDQGLQPDSCEVMIGGVPALPVVEKAMELVNRKGASA